MRSTGWRTHVERLRRASFTQRLLAMMLPLWAAALLPQALGWTGPEALVWQTLGVLAVSGVILWRFHRRITQALNDANRLASRIAGCAVAQQAQHSTAQHSTAPRHTAPHRAGAARRSGGGRHQRGDAVD